MYTPAKTLFYTRKSGVYTVHIFLFWLKNIKCGYLSEPPDEHHKPSLEQNQENTTNYQLISEIPRAMKANITKHPL